MNGLTWLQLSQSDNFLTKNLVDNLFFWIRVRKIAVPEPKIIPMIDCLVLLNLLQRYIVGVDKPNVAKCLDRFMSIPATRLFLDRFEGDRAVIQEFQRHARKYFEMHDPDCGFELMTTDRYELKSGVLETSVVAKKEYSSGDEIKYLTGTFAELKPDEEKLLDKSDFSIIHLSSRSNPCLMLGPARFVNHDCDANARFSSDRSGLKIYAIRNILVGEEITAQYATDYFGKDNKDCLCATCERLEKGYYDPEKFVIPEDADVIDISTSDGEDSSNDPGEHDVIVVDRESGSEDEVEDDNDGAASPTRRDCSNSNLSPVPIDMHEFDKARNERDKSDEKRITSIVSCIQLATDEPFVEPDSEEVGGRRLRPRRSIRMSENHMAKNNILPRYKRDNSLDSLVVEIPSLNDEIVKRRRINRILHKLLMTNIYKAEDMSNIYDCRHCGIYFKLLPDYFHRYSEFCQRCTRHQKIYGLAWPETKRKLRSGSHHAYQSGRLVLHENVQRMSLAEVKNVEPASVTLRRVSRKIKPTAEEHERKRETDHESDYFTESSIDSDNELSIPEVFPNGVKVKPQKKDSDKNGRLTNNGNGKVINSKRHHEQLFGIYDEEKETKKRPPILIVEETPSGIESSSIKVKEQCKKRQHIKKEHQAKLFDIDYTERSSGDTTPTKEEMMTSTPKYSPDDLFRAANREINKLSSNRMNKIMNDRIKRIVGNDSDIESITRDSFESLRREVKNKRDKLKNNHHVIREEMEMIDGIPCIILTSDSDED